MLNSKQRANLRSQASTTPATTILGKDGLTENVLAQIDRELLARELVKVSVLEGAELSAKDYLHEAAEKLKAEEVCSIGRKFVLYRYSNKKGVKHIEY
ncbi:MAG: YhbY family RNA-binding protein [Clostridia bacterium]|nr:YhbY family RNA-binding protein [Clostridia bacterium]MBR2391170.1 YhbY family RNA-binding protein [Clostridia bacterium]